MISLDSKIFIKKYSDAILEGDAAIFAGAGLSRPSGYVIWKELLREIAKDVRLDIDKENDLISVAQFYKNEMESRADLNCKIISEFTKGAKKNPTMDILSNLPINTYWTTNYDKIIESTLENKAKKKVDVKITQENLAENKPNRDVIVYKFHGDVSQPSQAILTKDDFELFPRTHQLFISSLQGDLISKTFLFIGYSLNDPNLMQILSQIRILLGENKRTHYCIFSELNSKDFPSQSDFLYGKVKQELVIKDLKRYGIQSILINKYSDIPELLNRIKERINQKNIFISGSFDQPTQEEDNYLYDFCKCLSISLIKNNYKIFTGLGRKLGKYLTGHAVSYLIRNGERHLEKYLQMLPFNTNFSPSQKRKHRMRMIERCRAVIFIFGKGEKYDENVDSKGVREEFEIAKELNKIIIPIGSTGFESKRIWEEINNNRDKYYYLERYLQSLNSEKNPKIICKTIISILQDIDY